VTTSLLSDAGLQRSRAIDGLGTCHISASGQFRLERTGPGVQTLTAPYDRQRDHPLFAYSERARAAARLTETGPLDYLILVPTLRCNLSCSYCQVSRAPIEQTRFDWTEQTLAHVIALLDSLETDAVKIEFQGGEPTLRLDLIQAVIKACARFDRKQFVICTNLAQLSDDFLTLLENPDVLVSTSLDGSAARHKAQRTTDDLATETFLANAQRIVSRFGADKLSALPTIDQRDPPEPDELIDAYAALGQTSIFLRPINYQGFARKRHTASNEDHGGWWAYYDRFIRRLIARNFADRSQVFEESYLSLCLQRIFQVGHDRHVDLRNPNPVGRDYVLVDYDGKIYPTDEARMLSRAGVVDLAIGTIEAGWDTPARALLDRHSTNIGDPVCDRCAYQPYCGRDIVDDLSRYGTIDKPRDETFFCQKHRHMFDLCMRLIYDPDSATRYAIAKWTGLASDRLPVMAEWR